MKFKDLLIPVDGMIKGPFGSDVKKSLFVSKGKNTVKVYEQSVVANNDYKVGNYYLDAGYAKKKLSRFFIKPGDILMTGAGTLGLLSIVPENIEEGVMNQALIRIRLNESIIYKPYFMYYFPWAIKDIACRINGDSVIPNLPPLNVLKDIDVEIPDIENQKQIADKLDLINSKISINQGVNSELESLAKTIYDYWFLQFEFPNEEGRPYKSSGGKMVWNNKLKREIPEGWRVDTIKSLILKDKGGDWGSEESKGNYTENVYCIRGADFPASLGKGTIEAPERWILPKNTEKELTIGDILIEISGGSPVQSTGRICYVNENYLKRFNKPVITSNFCKAISLKIPKDYVWFYETWQSLYNNGVFFNYEGKTTGLKNLLFDVATESLMIVIPDRGVLDKYAEKCNLLFETVQSNLIQNQELASLRDFLLPMLMNGQVTFKV